MSQTTSDKKTDRQAKGGRKLLIALVAVVVLAVLVGLAYGVVQISSGQNEADDAVPTYAVRQGPLEIAVSETGTIRAREQYVIKSEVEGNNTILYLIAEGEMVKKGDLLIELDASALQDKQVEQEIRVQNSEAAFVRAREQLEVTRNQSMSDIEQAELDLQFAKQDLDKYVKGEFPKQVKDAENKIIIAEEEVKRANQKVEWSQVLYKEKYISQSELQADELAAKRANLDLDLANADLALLNKYTHPRKLAELKSGVRQSGLALDRVKSKASADVVQAEADLNAKQSEFERQQDKLGDIEKQISKTKIVAPQSGQVVYATSTQMSWRGNQEPLAEGQSVRERQELIHLPVDGPMIAEVKIHETHRDKIEVGLPVQVKVDALPGRSYTGRVRKVAPLPDPTHVFMNPDLKVYKTEILLDQEDPSLRTGMNCRAEVLVASYDDALYVPIQAVTRVNSLPVVYVKSSGPSADFVPRVVELGLDNGRVVHITDNLSAGELVSLTPSLDPEDAAQVAQTAMSQIEPTASTGPGPGATPATATAIASGSDAGNAGSSVSPASGVGETAPLPQAREGHDQGQGHEEGQGTPAGVTQAQIEAFRKEMENLSPEQRRARIKQLRDQASQ